ncbi:hypothetical protein [Pseudoalteromonas sp. S16_S37]|uniref:hypothetical protein n=1 Tax=Pseudoalteromonas sp. S16_S37 TaxID=2720228 RepID=UPI001680D632|nr:hypothetical protein [Pseudoalteromonas sp. S16_S37]MBD1584500.1 hypothetical protein [Pseudoalteromonas sp. S16_S37]
MKMVNFDMPKQNTNQNVITNVVKAIINTQNPKQQYKSIVNEQKKVIEDRSKSKHNIDNLNSELTKLELRKEVLHQHQREEKHKLNMALFKNGIANLIPLGQTLNDKVFTTDPKNTVKELGNNTANGAYDRIFTPAKTNKQKNAEENRKNMIGSAKEKAKKYPNDPVSLVAESFPNVPGLSNVPSTIINTSQSLLLKEAQTTEHNKQNDKLDSQVAALKSKITNEEQNLLAQEKRGEELSDQLNKVEQQMYMQNLHNDQRKDDMMRRITHPYLTTIYQNAANGAEEDSDS